ncbi:putative E3 ubiquitin-protein ligase [Coemansia sp. RSA 990]|nr:putative E3 ubiquitin-protein ligase [Coemansia sp. RSA 1086]KAJ1869826.1 putative E3 ubiquitin-protein ligase [Coemansia sp. RSA 990]KAJ2676066.1 putative E3 ubiquitin-protein ligase [Coemansia sp. RSA 1085]
MVVSHLFSPLRTLKNKARGRGSGRRGSSSESTTSNEDVLWSDDQSPAAKPDDRSRPMVTGRCFCCASKVTYPDSVSCFKCTVCTTINDLKELVRTEKSTEDGQVVVRPRVPPPPLTLDRLRAGVQAYKRHPEKHMLLEAMIRESFGNWDVLNFSFSSGKPPSADDPGIMFTQVHAAYKLILSLPPPFIRAMMSAIEQTLRRPGRPLTKLEDIRYLLIIIENPLLMQQSFPQESSYHHHIVKSIVGSLANLPNRVHYSLVLWQSQQGRSSLKRKVQLVNQFISYRVQKYDRARNRAAAAAEANTQTAALPTTTYSEQSNQQELPAFQRIRSNTNAQARTTTRHNRMRSNTDSRIFMSAHRPPPVPESSDRPLPASRPQNEPAPNNPFYSHMKAEAATGANHSKEASGNPVWLGLGISNMSVRDPPTRFASLGSGHFSADHTQPVKADLRVPTAPTQTHLRSLREATEPKYSSVKASGKASEVTPPPPAYARKASTNNNDCSTRVSYYVPLSSGNDNIDPPPQEQQGPQVMKGIRSPPIDYARSKTTRMRAASMSASSLVTSEAVELEPQLADDAVRPPRDSVLGVLDGTAEPSSASRSSLTRTRSSSEAPMRRRRQQLQDDTAIVSAERRPGRAAGDWGVDMEDYFVGADGVFYPKSSSLVRHQHDWRLVAAARVMALLHAANLLLPTRSRLRLDAFYNSSIESMDLVADYDAWQARVPDAFSFCQYPFLLSLRAKMQIMQADAARQMDSKLKEAVISALFQSYSTRRAAQSQPHLKLLVRRRCLVEDSLHQLASHEQDLKKRLKIEFVGEEGVDAGGLTKEWFMLLLRELLNPMYGMFTCESEGGESYWFNPAALETSNQFFLVGVVVGLALYNSTILDLHLPLAVFKKLLRTGFYQASALGMSAAKSADAISLAIVSGNQNVGAAVPAATSAAGVARIAVGGRTAAAASNGQAGIQKKMAPYAPCYGPAGSNGGSNEGRSPVYGLLSPSAQLRYQISEMLTDVAQFRPELSRGLRQLLQYRGDDVEDVFCLTFEASYDAYGEVVTVPLVPNGSSIAVTSHNRVEFVLRYLQWVLNDSIAKQFEPFRRGFYYVCGSNALSLFKPEEIELMVHGSGEDWDPEALVPLTEYHGFSDQTKKLVEWFWQALQEMSTRERKLFLAFITGSDRLPTVMTRSTFKLKLMLLGAESNRLPIAHTCFNQLGLWQYRTKDELKHKLMMAINESEGFGLK